MFHPNSRTRSATYLKLLTPAVFIPVIFYTDVKANEVERTHDILHLVKHSMQFLLQFKYPTI